MNDSKEKQQQQLQPQSKPFKCDPADTSPPSEVAREATNMNTKRIKDLESLIEKKFSNKQDEQKLACATGNNKSFDDDDFNSNESKSNSPDELKLNDEYKYVDSNEKLTHDDYDDYDETEDEDNLEEDNRELEDEDEDEEDQFSVKTSTFNTDSSSSKQISQLDKDLEFKALNDYIRSNADFKFERLETHSNDVHPTEMDYDHDYSQSELENDEQIRRIIQLCKLKFPELKYKITKCVKTVFKEKFRAAYKKTEEKIKSQSNNIKSTSYQSDTNNNNNNNSNNSSNKQLPQQLISSHSISNSLQSNNNNNNNSNRIISPNSKLTLSSATTNNASAPLAATNERSIFKPHELKSNKINETSNSLTKQSNSLQSSALASASFKHSISSISNNNNNNSDFKPAKKLKSSSNENKSDEFTTNKSALINNKSSESLKSLQHSLHSQSPLLSSVTSSSSSPYDTKYLFNQSISQSTSSSPGLLVPPPPPGMPQPPSGLLNSSSSSSASTGPLFDPEFMRIAAAAAAASSNPLFRFPDFSALNNPYFASLSNLFRAGPNSPSISPFSSLNSPSTYSSAPSNGPSNHSLSLSVGALTSNNFNSNSLNSNSVNINNNNNNNNSIGNGINSSKSLISPTSKSNGNFFSPSNHHSASSSHHSFKAADEQSNNEKQSSSSHKHHSSSSSSNSCINSNTINPKPSSFTANGDGKHTNGNINTNHNNVTSSISSYILSSSKLKLNSKFSKLSPADIQTIKGLINGYRESAAFLNRTVEELEQLLNESTENDSK